jgi:hypothetical protein
MSLTADDFLIDDDFDTGMLLRPVVDGQLKGRGAVPRDYAEFPTAMFAPPSEIPEIPESEWSARIKEMEETKSRLSDIRDVMGPNGGPIPSLDQGNQGYCWAHSTVHACMLVRAINGQPYVPLSAYMVAAIIKKGANEGGWCGLSWEFLKEVGVCSQKLWPQGNRDYRTLDTPAVRADAAKNKVLEDWVDLTRPEWDKRLTFRQAMSCALSRHPFAIDLNWWAHSIAVLDPVEVEPGSFGFRIWNSWSDAWGAKGTSVLRGTKAIPDGAVAIRVLPGVG